MAVFQKVADRLNRNRNTVIFGTIAAFLMGVVGSALMWADFNSSRMGVEALDMRTSIPGETIFVGAIFQIVQIVVMYVAGNKEKLDLRMTYAMWIVYVLCLIGDVGTDTYYKAYGYPFGVQWLIAFIYSVTVFTVGSEIMFVTGWSLFIEVAPDGIGKIGQFFGKIYELIAAAFTYLFSEVDNDQPNLPPGMSNGGRKR